MPLLLYVDERGVEKRQPVKAGTLSIGRLVENDLVLIDPQVSRKHCVIEKAADGWTITDLGSRYGTFVNDQPVRRTSPLKPGDRVRLGTVPLTFADDGAMPVAVREPVEATDTGGGGDRTVGQHLVAARAFAETLAAFVADPKGDAKAAREAADALLARIGTIHQSLEDLERNQRFAYTLDEVGKLLGNVKELLPVLNLTLEAAVDALSAERGYILIDHEGKLVPRVTRNMGDPRGISTSIAEQVVFEMKPILTTDATVDPRFKEAQSVMVHGIRAVMCVPLLYKEKCIGAIYVDGKPGNRAFGEHGLKFLEVFASQAAIAIDSAILADRNAREEEYRRALSRYLPAPVVKRLARGELANEKRLITTMFTDIRGFTSLLEKLPPSDAVDMLNGYFGELVTELDREEGTLDKFTGDGIMAFWNAPNDQPDHALRAVRAALAMQARLPGLQERWKSENRPWARIAGAISTGIGIHTGEAVTGNIGSASSAEHPRLEYTAIGDAVNLAARVQGVAKGGEVLVTAETRALLGDRVAAEELAPVALKGKSQLVPIFRVTAAK